MRALVLLQSAVRLRERVVKGLYRQAFARLAVSNLKKPQGTQRPGALLAAEIIFQRGSRRVTRTELWQAFQTWLYQTRI